MQEVSIFETVQVLFSFYSVKLDRDMASTKLKILFYISLLKCLTYCETIMGQDVMMLLSGRTIVN